MADPLPSGPRASEAPSAGDDARIEQLLVTGLDHYFAGEHEAAISVWTRVLFLDRSHDRARAYIERARSAQAEQLRASEAIVHEGLQAFDRGEVAKARALLRQAIDQGGAHDMALGVMGRIDRLDVPAPRTPEVKAPRPRRFVRSTSAIIDAGSGRRVRWMWGAVIVALVATAAAVWSVSPEGAAWWNAPATERPAVAALPVSPLPVPPPTEAYLSRARALFAEGRLRDAQREADRVPIGDLLRPDADRLRAQIQRELLATTAIDLAPATLAPPAPVTPPE